MTAVIIGFGVVGQNMANLFPFADVHDPDQFLVAKDSYDIGFVCVPTDSLPDGAADTSIVEEVVRLWAPRCSVLVIKSTVPPGTTQGFIDQGYAVVMSPEYYGATQHANGADYDFVILGGERADTAVVAAAYEEIKRGSFQIKQTDATTAELVKYGENAWLATKVSFCNEFARIANAVGVDYREFRELWLLDPRINPSHTFVYEASPFYDSHCLNKDIPAIIEASSAIGYYPELLMSIAKYNHTAKENHRK